MIPRKLLYVAVTFMIFECTSALDNNFDSSYYTFKSNAEIKICFKETTIGSTVASCDKLVSVVDGNEETDIGTGTPSNPGDEVGTCCAFAITNEIEVGTTYTLLLTVTTDEPKEWKSQIEETTIAEFAVETPAANNYNNKYVKATTGDTDVLIIIDSSLKTTSCTAASSGHESWCDIGAQSIGDLSAGVMFCTENTDNNKLPSCHPDLVTVSDETCGSMTVPISNGAVIYDLDDCDQDKCIVRLTDYDMIIGLDICEKGSGEKCIGKDKDEVLIIEKEGMCHIEALKVFADLAVVQAFDDILEVQWKTYSNNKPSELYNLASTIEGLKDIHVDCTHLDTPDTDCYGYIFDYTDNTKDVGVTLAQCVHDSDPCESEWTQTRITFHAQSGGGDEDRQNRLKKSLKPLKLDIVWQSMEQSAKGSFCLYDLSPSKPSGIKHIYKLVVANEDGKWISLREYDQHDNTICFNNITFEKATFQPNSKVRILALKTNKETKSIVSSNLVTTQLTLPEVEVLTNSLAKVQLHNGDDHSYVIKDARTAQILAKNNGGRKQSTYVRIGEQNGGVCSKQVVLQFEEREHFNVKVHFITPDMSNRNHNCFKTFKQEPIPSNKLTVIEIEKQAYDNGTLITFSSSEPVKKGSIVVFENNDFTTTKDYKNGEEIPAYFPYYNIQVTSEPLQVVLIVESIFAMYIFDIPLENSSTTVEAIGTDDESVRIQVAKTDSVKNTEYLYCNKQNLCYGLEEQSHDSYSICTQVTNNPEKQEISFCQPVYKEQNPKDDQIPITSIEMNLSENKVVLKSEMFTSDDITVELLSYSADENHELYTNKTEFGCIGNEEDPTTCSSELITDINDSDISHLVVATDNNGIVINSSTFLFTHIKPSTKQVSRSLTEISWESNDDSPASYNVSIDANAEGSFDRVTKYCSASDEQCRVYFKISKEATTPLFSIQKNTENQPTCIMSNQFKIEDVSVGKPINKVVRDVTDDDNKVDLCSDSASYTTVLLLDVHGEWLSSSLKTSGDTCFYGIDIDDIDVDDTVTIAMWVHDGSNSTDSVINFINPLLEQKAKNKIMVEMQPKTEHDVDLVINAHTSYKLQCTSTDQICAIYVHSEGDLVNVLITETINGTKQSLKSSVRMKSVISFDSKIEMSIHWNGKIKACFPFSEHTVELSLLKNHKLIDESIESLFEDGNECLLSNILEIGGYISFEVVVSAYNQNGEITKSAEDDWKTISLIKNQHVYLGMMNSTTYEGSWNLISDLENIKEYYVSLHSEDRLLESANVDKSNNVHAFTVSKQSKYAICVQVVAEEEEIKSETKCSDLTTESLTNQVPEIVHGDWLKMKNLYSVYWTYDEINADSYYISWFKSSRKNYLPPQIKHKYALSAFERKDQYAIVPSSKNSFDITSEDIDTISIRAMKSGIMGKELTMTVINDGADQLDPPNNVKYNDATKILSWDEVTDAESYVVVFDKGDVHHSESTVENKINIKDLVIPGKWDATVQSQRAHRSSDLSKTTVVNYSGITIMTTQMSTKVLEIKWYQYPPKDEDETYTVTVESNSEDIPCDGVDPTRCIMNATSLKCGTDIKVIVKAGDGQSNELTTQLICINSAKNIKATKSSSTPEYNITWDSDPLATAYILEHLDQNDKLLLKKRLIYKRYVLDGNDLENHVVRVTVVQKQCIGDPQDLIIKSNGGGGGGGGGDDSGVETWIIVVSCIGAILFIAVIIGAVFIARSKSSSRKSKRPDASYNSNEMSQRSDNIRDQPPRGFPTADDLIPQIGQRRFPPTAPPKPAPGSPRAYRPYNNRQLRTDQQPRQYDEWESRPLGQPQILPRLKPHLFKSNSRPTSPPNHHRTQEDYRF